MSARSDDDVLIAKLGRLRGRIVMLDDRALLDTAMLRLATLTRERDEARRDGERLDWLERNHADGPYPAMCEGDSLSWWELPSDPVVGDRGTPYQSLRAAIDAAISTTATTALGCQPPVLSCGEPQQENHS